MLIDSYFCVNNFSKFLNSKIFLKNMKKKSQVTLFVIIAILVVVIFLVITYFTPLKERFVSTSFETQTNEIKTYTDSCMRDTIRKVILETGKKSGYYEQHELSTDGIAYYFYEEQNLLPSLDLLESELEKGFKKEFNKCLQNFSFFKKQGLRINTSEPEAKVNITQTTVIFEFDFLITLKKFEKTAIINCSKTELIQVQLGKIYNLATNIVKDCLEGESIYLTKFSDIPPKEKLILNITLIDRVAIFNITDLNSRIGNETYSFLFAGRF